MWELRDNRYGRRYFATLVEAGRPTAGVPRLPATSSRTIVHVTREQATATMTLADVYAVQELRAGS